MLHALWLIGPTGHRQAYEKGLIHYDVSEGNVMICRDPFSPFKGFIHDLDVSFSWKHFLARRGIPVELATWVQYCVEHGHEPAEPGESGALDDSKARAGTPPFMSVEVLEGVVTHEARHDLESFFWLFLYIILKHTKHNHRLGHRAFHHIFGGTEAPMEMCSNAKLASLLFHPPVEVENNAGLTYILKEFHDLCSRNFAVRTEHVARPGMTHRDVLDIFNKALTMEWPAANDGPRAFEDETQLNGQSADQPEDHPQGPGTADNSEMDGADIVVTDSSDDEGSTDIEKRCPNVSAADQGLALLDVGSRIPDTIVHDPIIGEDVHEDVPASGVGQASGNGSDAPQGLAVHPTLAASQQPPYMNDGKESTTVPSSQANPPSTTRRAPVRGRAQATRRPAGDMSQASNVDRVATQPGRRYNLRSNSNVATPESVQPRMTRSQTKAAPQQQDAGMKGPGLGKRTRATRDDAGLLDDGQSSKRRRTLRQTRERKTPKSGKK